MVCGPGDEKREGNLVPSCANVNSTHRFMDESSYSSNDVIQLHFFIFPKARNTYGTIGARDNIKTTDWQELPKLTHPVVVHSPRPQVVPVVVQAFLSILGVSPNNPYNSSHKLTRGRASSPRLPQTSLGFSRETCRWKTAV